MSTPKPPVTLCTAMTSKGKPCRLADTYKPTKPATSGRVWAEPGASGETPLTDTRLSDPPIDPTNEPETHA